MERRKVLLLVTLAAFGAVVLVGCISPARKTPETAYDVAKDYQAKEKYDAAISKFREFVLKNEYPPLNPYALYNIAMCQQLKKDNAEALKTFKQVTEQYPASEPVVGWAKAAMKEIQKAKTPKPGTKKK